MCIRDSNKAPANSFYALMLLASSYLLENENLRALNEFYYIVDNIDQHKIDDDFKNIILENSKNYLDYILKNRPKNKKDLNKFSWYIIFLKKNQILPKLKL